MRRRSQLFRTAWGVLWAVFALSGWSAAQFGSPAPSQGKAAITQPPTVEYTAAMSGAAQSADQPQQPAQPVSIIQGPRIEYADENSAIIAWSTNVPSSTVVHYGTDPNRLDQRTRAPWGAETHRVDIRNLQPSTTYFFRVVSAQARGTGTQAQSDEFAFRTTAPGQAATHQQSPAPISEALTGTHAGSAGAVQITNGPVVEFVGDHSAVIAWSTNVPASSVLRYGTDPNSLGQMAEAPWGSKTHRISLQNLTPNTRYYFQVESSQAQGTGTASRSQPQGFTTVPPGAQAQRYPRPQ